ncbi:MAG: threonine synthase [Pseudomonadales bacterium]
MKYVSTRGSAPVLGFEDVLLAGMASDGGLYVPEKLPSFTENDLERLSTLSYAELAFEILSLFVDGEIEDDALRGMINDSYAEFAHPSVTPLVQLGHDQWVLELFHGPTLAFKDVALQLLGRLFEHVLSKRKQRVVILGATSGDTGSAAIEGCRHGQHVDIFILHPHQRVSDVQRRQMTTVLDDHVFNIAVQGNFDDCQAIVKASFADQSFLPDGRQLVAVNSINWARIMAQIVYYFYAAFQLGSPAREISFSVPTGNFGDIFAGYLASKMGLPIKRLLIATNRNDILHRTLNRNDCKPQELQHTLSPSMDIMVSSNFERLLFDLYQRDGAAIADLMSADAGAMSLSDEALQAARALFSSARADDQQTCATISDCHKNTGYLLDPHTATGVYAAQQYAKSNAEGCPVVTLATAHPAKFPEAIRKSGVASGVDLPAHMSDLFEREERFTVLPNDIAAVQQYVAEHCTSGSDEDKDNQ